MASKDRSVFLRRVAEHAAVLAGRLTLAAFRSDFTPTYKDASLHNLLTEYDISAERLIREEILRCEPSSCFVGEELGSTNSGGVTWYIDPIDGTANFARGLPFWCVSIAAAIDDEIVAGVVFDPLFQHVFAADLTGTWLNGTALKRPIGKPEREATLLTGYPSARDFLTDGDFISHFNFKRLVNAFSVVRRPGSAALSITYVAAGWADVAMGVEVFPWDIAAASFILRQAGGIWTPLLMPTSESIHPAHICGGYIATASEADYPTAQSVGIGISDKRRDRPK